VYVYKRTFSLEPWIPAYAGMTGWEIPRIAVRLRGDDELRDIPEAVRLRGDDELGGVPESSTSTRG